MRLMLAPFRLALMTVPRLLEAIPQDRLGGLSIVRVPDVRLRVRVTPGRPLGRLQALLDGFGTTVEVVAGGSTVRDRIRFVDQAARMWRSAWEDVEGIYVDEASDDIVVMVAETGAEAARHRRPTGRVVTTMRAKQRELLVGASAIGAQVRLEPTSRGADGIYKGQNGSTGTNARVWWTKLGNMPAGMNVWVA